MGSHGQLTTAILLSVEIVKSKITNLTTKNPLDIFLFKKNTLNLNNVVCILVQIYRLQFLYSFYFFKIFVANLFYHQYLVDNNQLLPQKCRQTPLHFASFSNLTYNKSLNLVMKYIAWTIFLLAILNVAKYTC